MQWKSSSSLRSRNSAKYLNIMYVTFRFIQLQIHDQKVSNNTSKNLQASLKKQTYSVKCLCGFSATRCPLSQISINIIKINWLLHYSIHEANRKNIEALISDLVSLYWMRKVCVVSYLRARSVTVESNPGYSKPAMFLTLTLVCLSDTSK